MHREDAASRAGHAQGEKKMPQMSGGDAVVQALSRHGIESIYCLPGIQSDHLFNALFDAGEAIKVVHTRHEQGAAYMALGAALATGKPQAFSVVPGPGLLNATAALATAYSTSAPVLALAGQIPSRSIGRGHGMLHEIRDQIGILRTMTKWAERIERPQDAPGLVAQAFQVMAAGRKQPVGLEIAPDILQARADVDDAAPLPALEQRLDEDAIGRAAQLMEKAERPLIFVGGGALDAGPEVRALAERLGAPVATYRRGKGVMDHRHPLAHVVTGGHELWKTADIVLAVGTRLQWPSAVWGVDEKLTVIKVDADPDEMDRVRTPELAIVGDAAAVLRRMAEHLRHLPEQRPDRVAASLKVKQETAKKLAVLEPQGAYCRAIRDVLPDNGVLVEELTQVAYASRLLYEARHPRSFITSGYQGTLGWGVATALGVKHALGDVPVVSINGDGGFLFTAQELATAVRHRIPLVTVVFNDAAYGNVRYMPRNIHGNRVIGTDLANPDFIKFGESFGVLSLRANGPETLRGALEKALDANEPALIEVPVGDMPFPWPFIDLPRVRGKKP
jgi:acetolactate synthase-1/2/3 large subunit